MTTTAIVMMSVSIGTILVLLSFCLFRIMTSPVSDEQ